MGHLPKITVVAAALFASAALAQAPHGSEHAPSNPAIKDSHVARTSQPASGANSFTEEQAKTRIAKAGYKNISELKKDDQGLWQGTATWKGIKKHVALDYKGNVSSK